MIDKPSSKEDEFIAKQEFARLKQIEDDAAKNLQDSEKTKLQELHHMRCPKCGMQLIELDYMQIKIDKCSSCEGIWLDAGELDEILHDEKGRLKGFLGMFKK